MDRLHSKVVMVFLAVFMSAGVFAHTVPGGAVFKAALNGGEEVSTVTIPGASGPVVNGPVVTGAFGMVHFKLSADRQSLEYQLQASNFGTPVIAAHIHLGPKGANGPVLVTLFNRATQGDFTGMVSGTITAANLTPQPAMGVNTFEDLLNNMAFDNAYVNVHSERVPAGEIRGQLKQPRGKDKD